MRNATVPDVPGWAAALGVRFIRHVFVCGLRPGPELTLEKFDQAADCSPGRHRTPWSMVAVVPKMAIVRGVLGRQPDCYPKWELEMGLGLGLALGLGRDTGALWRGPLQRHFA